MNDRSLVYVHNDRFGGAGLLVDLDVLSYSTMR